MAELRKDPISGRWVIVDTDHPRKPSDFEKVVHESRSEPCPFCYGNEYMTPPEINAVRHKDTQPNSPGWTVRTVPNKFPALRIEGDLDRIGVGMYDMTNGIGAHEVIIETPYHHKDISDLTNEEVTMMIDMYCRRASDLQNDKRFKYILIFKNHGVSAGATLEHPHTQLIALPMVPKAVVEELQGAKHYYDYRDRCIMCDIIKQEIQEKERIITDNKSFISFCPLYSRFPFEVHITPKNHQSCFCQMSDFDKQELAVFLKESLAKIKTTLGDPAYNFIIHTSPIDKESFDYYHWHIEIMPRLVRVAGFEWGTGFYVVPTPPEIAAQYLNGTKKD